MSKKNIKFIASEPKIRFTKKTSNPTNKKTKKIVRKKPPRPPRPTKPLSPKTTENVVRKKVNTISTPSQKDRLNEIERKIIKGELITKQRKNDYNNYTTVTLPKKMNKSNSYNIDINSLRQRNIVREEIMDEYFKLYFKNKRNVAYILSDFYINLEKIGEPGYPNSVNEVLKKFGITKTTFTKPNELYIPVWKEGTHWILLRILYKYGVYQIFDSIRDGYIDDVVKNMKLVFTALKLKQLENESIEVPTLTNRYDCGVFVMEYMRRLITGKDIMGFSEANMPFIRKRIKKEIHDQKCISDDECIKVKPRKEPPARDFQSLTEKRISDVKFNESIINRYLTYCYNKFGKKNKIKIIGYTDTNFIDTLLQYDKNDPRYIGNLEFARGCTGIDYKRIDKYSHFIIPIKTNKKCFLIELNFHKKFCRIYDPDPNKDWKHEYYEKYWNLICDFLENWGIDFLAIDDQSEKYYKKRNKNENSDMDIYYVLYYIYCLMKGESLKFEDDMYFKEKVSREVCESLKLMK